MKYVLIAGIIIFIGFVIALQFIPIGIEPLTEVYFENHTSLPKYLFLNRFYNFTFTVRNLEYKDMNYSYNIFIEYPSNNNTIESGDFSIADNSTYTRFVKFGFNKSFEKARINVLIGKENNETIDLHFYVEEITGPKIVLIPN